MMSRIGPPQDAAIHQPLPYNRQTRGSTVEPLSNQRSPSITLPPSLVQPSLAAMRYPFYRTQSPQISGQNSVPNSPCCPGRHFPRFVAKAPTLQYNHQELQLQHTATSLPYPVTTHSATTLSCIATPIIQRHVRYLARQVVHPEEALKNFSSSVSSRDSGIMSQDSSTSSQFYANDDNNEQWSTGDCKTKRAKRLEAPTWISRGSTGSNKVSKGVNSGSRIPSTSNSAASSPATPQRTSLTSSYSTKGERDSVHNVGHRVGRSTSLCSRTLDRGKKEKTALGRPDTTDMTTPTTTNSARIPRPTNLAGNKSSRVEKEVATLARKVHQIFKVEEKTQKNSSPLLRSDRQFSATATPPSQIPAPRAKTLSPPPQFAASTTPPKTPFTNSITPDSSSTSTCTLAAESKGSKSSFLNRPTSDACSNLDDTPTPSNRETPEPQEPAASAAPQMAVTVEAFDNLAIPAMSMSPRSPRLSPRLAGAEDDQSRGSFGYGPLSCIKLPYSTPMMQRMQPITNESGPGLISGGRWKREKSTFCTPGQPLLEAFGSHLSLTSSGLVVPLASNSSDFETAKLRHELELAHQKVAALTCQLSANTRVIQAFEQSLQSMNQRLHQLSASSALKEREVREMRKIIDRLRCQALQTDWNFSMDNSKNGKKLSQSQEFVKSHHILDSDIQQQAGSLSSLVQSPLSTRGGLPGPIGRGYMSPSYVPLHDSLDHVTKKAGWFRASFNRAFRRSKSRDPPDCTKVTSTSSHDPNLPSPGSSSSVRHSPASSSSESPSTTGKMESEEGGESMATDVGGVMELMQETLRQLQHQVFCLNAENAFLQRAVNRSTLATSESSAPASTPGSLFLSSNLLRIKKLIGELFAVSSEIGQNSVPVFLGLNYKQMSCDSSNEAHIIRRTPAPSPNYLSLSGEQILQMGSASPNAVSKQIFPGETKTNNFSYFHLLGRVYLDQSADDLRSKVKNLFSIYLNYLDPEDQLGITANGIASIYVKVTPKSINYGQPAKEFHLSPYDNDCIELEIESGYEISRITISLHDNAYALERPVAPNLLNPIAVSSIAWISLLPAPLLSKMIQSLLANKCVIIYGPRGSGKLEFGRILIDSMAKMFSGFWMSEPTTTHYCLRASPNAVMELRQVLLNALLSVEGLVILRLPISLLQDLVNIMTELGFNSHPRKTLLLAITDTLVFPEESTKLRNCPGIFPFLADIQSAFTYMRRCLRQRFSQHAFQCLGAENLANTTELNALIEIIEWLPEFWHRYVTAPAWNSPASEVAHSAFVLSPFVFLACPLTLQGSFVWFREVCDLEGVFYRIGESNKDLVQWIAATWPWPNEKSPFVFAAPEHLSFPSDPVMTSSTSASMIMCDSSASLPALLSPTGSGGSATESGRFGLKPLPYSNLRR